MNITRETKDDLNAIIKVEVKKEDYEQQVNEKLKEYKKNARFDGFRPGMAPMGLIRRLYRKPLLLEEINRIVSESLTRYIKDEELNILGEPLPNKELQETPDFDNQEDFEFVFDIAIAPDFEVNISKRDKLPYYEIDVDDEMLDKYADSYANRFGESVEVQEVGDNDIITASLTQISENGEPAEGGIQTEDSTLSVSVIKDEDIKKEIAGSKTGDILTIDLRKAYPNDTELSKILNTDKEKIENIQLHFQLKINSVSRWEKAEINQELFDKAFGEGKVKSEEEFRKRIADEISFHYSRQSDYKLLVDFREKMINKTKFDLPEDFLKRWLLESNEKKITEEQLEKEFPEFVKGLRWQLIQDKIIGKFGLKVEKEEVEDLAKEHLKMQFRQYGMTDIGDEHLDNYAAEMLKKEDERRKLYEQKFQEKIIELVKNSVNLNPKKLKEEEFAGLFRDE